MQNILATSKPTMYQKKLKEKERREKKNFVGYGWRINSTGNIHAHVTWVLANSDYMNRTNESNWRQTHPHIYIYIYCLISSWVWDPFAFSASFSFFFFLFFVFLFFLPFQTFFTLHHSFIIQTNYFKSFQ